MPRPPDVDVPLIRALHQLVVEDSAFRSALAAAFETAREVLDRDDHTLPYAGEEVPPASFKTKLGEDLRDAVNLCRVFILRRGRRMDTPENHRNSVQRLVSWRGRGVIHCAAGSALDMRFEPFPIQAPEDAPIMDPSPDPSLFWDVVPMNTWHFPEAGEDEDWHTVTFHSATSGDILDEYAAPMR